MKTREGYPFRFECRRSGNCCAIPGGIVRVDDADMRAIAAHLGVSIAAFVSRYVHSDGTRLVDGLGSRCVFLRDGTTAECSIYPVRPQKCRDWPFWPEVVGDSELLRSMQRTCPGIEPRAE